MTGPAHQSGASPVLRGVALSIAGMFTLAWMDALSKILTVDYPAPQILWVRFLVFLLFGLAWAWHRERRISLKSNRPFLQVIRSLTLVAEIACFVISFRYMGLAEAHSIGAAAPLIVTALAVFMLGEKIGPRRIAAIVGGLVGVLVILRPGLGIFSVTSLWPLAAAFLFALYQVFTRMVSEHDTPTTTLIWTGLAGFVALSFIAPFVWIAPDAKAWGLLILASLLGAMGHFMLIKALELAPATTIQPFNYSIFIWAILVGYAVFGHLSDAFTLAGGGIIVLSGLYALWRERVKSR